MAVALREPIPANELDSARRAAEEHLTYGFTPPLSEHERENFAAEGVASTLEANAAGAAIENLPRYVKRAARNAAIDAGRREEGRTRSLETAIGVSDGALGPADRVEVKNQLAAAIDALREFPPEDRALFQAKKLDGMKLGEIVEATKRPRRTVSRRVRKMEAAVAAAAIDLSDPQRKLLWDLANGAAQGPRKLRAQWLVQHSTDAANLVVRFKRLNENAAAALPAPVALERPAEGSLVDRFAGLPGRLRDEVLGRGVDGSAASSTAESATAVAQSGAGRAGGAAAGGVLAKLGAGGALGAKGIAACVGGGAATAACVAAGIVPGVGIGGEERPRDQRPAAERATEPAKPVGELPAPNPELTAPAAEATTTQRPASVAAEVVPAPPPPEDATAPPPEEVEFGLPAAPSAPGSETEAAPSESPTADGGGAAAAREFGP